MRTIQDLAAYLTCLVRDGILKAALIIDVITLLIKSFVPSTRRPPILDEPSMYLAVLAVGFLIAAYRLDRDLRAKLARQRSALCKELMERLIDLKFTIERRDKERIPMDQFLKIYDLAKDLGDGYVIAECEQIGSALQPNYDGGRSIASLFEDARKDYESATGRIDYILKYLRENQQALESKSSVESC